MKKWLFCEGCEIETWFFAAGKMYRCGTCDKEVDLFKAKMLQSQMRKDKRTVKQKQMGTYESTTAKKERRESNRREVDKRYIWWVHGWRCCVPECNEWPVQAHHVDRKSQGGSDRSAVALCAFHHTGSTGVHGLGVDTFEGQHEFEFKDVVKYLNKEYDAEKVGPNHGALEPFDGDSKYEAS